MIVVVTGAGSGIGKAIAKEYKKQGHKVIALTREDGDVSNYFDVQKMCKRFVNKKTIIGILINCAAIKLEKPFQQTTIKEFEKIVNTNYLGYVYVIKELLPFMRRGSHIVNVGSTHGLFAGDNQAAYSASKFAVTGFSQAIRKEFESLGISVHLICPSATYTGDYDYEGRMLSVQDVVELVLDSIEHNKFLVLPSLEKRIVSLLKCVSFFV